MSSEQLDPTCRFSTLFSAPAGKSEEAREAAQSEGIDSARGCGLQAGQPGGGGCVARHAPVAARGQADGTHLGTVEETRALELTGEEAAEEDREPAADLVGGVGARELRLRSQEEDLVRTRAVAQEVVQEE